MDYTPSDDPITAAAEHLASVIHEHLGAGERVLWLLSGGSGIQVVLKTASLLSDVNLSQLSATLSDERYGPVDHQDENWKQLLDGGLHLPGATLYRPLIGKDAATTADEFGVWMKHQMTVSDYKIGLFGIGSDGHTAGIKPHSSAATAVTWADCYIGEDFERITITPFGISQLDEAVIQASGTDKTPTLERLLHNTIEIIDQPGQVLKSITKCTLYTDNKELLK
jgi:6-phosphogluconolactonase/glucosamine-6-phosphate isomerase/deaminase